MDGIKLFGNGLTIAATGQAQKAASGQSQDNGFAGCLDKALEQERDCEAASGQQAAGICNRELMELRARFDGQAMQPPAHVIERAQSLVNDEGEVAAHTFTV
ncbi:hypothetical protein [Salidesulfovibrio onnuriiensis]|uniref:hypothetical protein n=1 Tax=Salidesulfovibrio onnuriiensis TaxID=2583823 RepID=UPI0011C94470|nr:hypothetical protein [Salidesulfovibrio onnuriiensis]